MAAKTKIVKDVYYNINKTKCENAEFIRAVRNNPALYDPENNDYKIANAKDAIWKELANQFEVTCDVAKKRWKSLRDTYTKKFRISEEHASNFKYGKELQFLKPFMKSERSNNIINVTKMNSNSQSDLEFECKDVIEEYEYDEFVQCVNEKDLLTKLDIANFIYEVKNHVSIWNQNLNSYNLLEERNRAWLDIGKNLIEDFDNIDQINQNSIVKIFRRKWRRLRERYLGIKKIQETRPEYNPDKIFAYFSLLTFIEKGFKQKKESNEDENKDVDFSITMNAEYLNDSPMNENLEEESFVELLPENSSLKLEKQIEQQKSLDVDLNEDEDEDRLFLLSLIKEMKKIPKDHKIDARLNILVVLRNWQKMQYDTNLDD